MPLTLAAAAMGTRFELVLDGLPEPALRAAGEEALAEIERADRELSAFRADSQIAHLNRHGAGGWVRLDPAVVALLDRCLELSRATRGCFDPALGGLMERWGFRGEAAAAEGAAPEGPPGPASARLAVDAGASTVRLGGTATRVDLGAIGKGLALDRAARVLREAGVSCALLHGGTSTALALGAPPGALAWRVAIADPRDPSVPLAVVPLRDGALAVSAPHGRTVLSAGERLGHVLDPRTGAPAARSTLAAALHAEAATADAWSTALLVGGEDLLDDRALAAAGVSALWLGRGADALPRQAGVAPQAFAAPR